jgi:YYY domain-containing protein
MLQSGRLAERRAAQDAGRHVAEIASRPVVKVRGRKRVPEKRNSQRRRRGVPALAQAVGHPSSLRLASATSGRRPSLPKASRVAARSPQAPSSAGAQRDPSPRWRNALSSVRRWATRRDWTIWALFAIAVLAVLPRIYGLNWDANNQLHPDEREIMFRAICLGFPSSPHDPSCGTITTGPNWFFSVNSPLNPHFFAYGSFPLYLVAAVAHGLAWLTHVTNGRFVPPDGGVWDDFNHFTLVGRVLSALFDTGTVLLSGLLARRLAGRWAGVLAAAFVAVIPFDVQVSHFYAVDTLLVFFVLLTLLACVRLVQRGDRVLAVEEREAADGSIETAEYLPTIWSSWRGGLFIGVAFGLAMATKISALPLLAPIALALILLARRRGIEHAAFTFLGIAGAALLTFAVTSPYAFIDSTTFWQQINEQTMLSRGQLDYPYVRHFAGTKPFVYQLQQMILYDMGLPLALLGLAGLAWAVSRVWRRWDDEWGVVVVFLAGYYAVVGSAYVKYTRYMLPVFAPLAVCGAAALVALARWGATRIAASNTAPASPTPIGWDLRQRITQLPQFAFGSTPARRLTVRFGPRWWRTVCVALGVGVLAISAFFTIALLHIYSLPNTRIQASTWMYDHIPANSTVTYEIWDRGLPLDVPASGTNALGEPLTKGGNVIDPNKYQIVGLDIYGEDTPIKADQLSQQLASADAVVLSSNHLLHSIPLLPDRYPMTARYYQLLFAGKLGFTLAYHAAEQPSFLGISQDDSGAEESWSYYDHPPVWIFTRQGAGLSQDQIKSLLTDGISLPAASTRSGSQKSLLLPPQNLTANAQGSTLDAQFSPDSLANHIPVLWWLLVVELLGLLTFPLTFHVFRGLHDRGWGFSKLLGLLLLAFAIWLPSSLQILPFDRWAVFAGFGLLAVIGGALAWWRRRELLAFARARWRTVLVGELAFLAIFLLFVWIRAQDPDLWQLWNGGEKPMDFAYLNAILRSRYMPPLDPFFSGGYINYYYYGLFLVAVLIKLTGIVPAVAFNLAIPLLAALTFFGAYSVVAGLTRHRWAGVAAGVGLVLVSNLDGLQQLWGQWQAALAHLPIPGFDYWRSSRVIPTTINEYPFWSFLFADLHAHVIDLPIVVLLIGCCASLLASARRDARRWRYAAPTLAAVALALGAAWCTNTWDVPTCAALVAVVLAVRLLPLDPRATWLDLWRAVTWPTIRNYAVALGLTLAAAYALYLPFQANYQNLLPGGTGPVTTPTPPGLFFVLFGIWLFLAASFLLIELHARFEAAFAARDDEPPYSSAARSWGLTLGWALILLIAFLASLKLLLIVLLAVGVVLALNPRHPPAKLMTFLLLLLGLGLAFAVETIYIRDFLDNSDYERMNTVFKFYYQAWVLFALGGALALYFIVRRLFGAGRARNAAHDTIDADDASVAPRARFTNVLGLAAVPLREVSAWALRGLWVAIFVALLFGSTVYDVEGAAVRVQDPAAWAGFQPPVGGLQPQGLSLNGEDFLKGWFPGDYQAINWINANISGAPTIVEAGYTIYYRELYGRVAMFTGLPDVFQPGHESEQRYAEAVGIRQNELQTFWGTDDPTVASSFLREYGVQYVYLGAMERTCYAQHVDPTTNATVCDPLSGAALAKFSALVSQGTLRVVYHTADVDIYKVIS